MNIDSHQHFWRYNETDFPWITDALAKIKRDFLPADLAPLHQASGIDGSIAVQARQSLEETSWLLELADENESIRGVVGWLPFCDSQIDSALERFASRPKLVGARHIIHDEPDDAFILRDDFNAGIRKLAAHDLVYDILIFEKHLPATIEFVDRHPDIPFVVDHIAKPKIRPGNFDQAWRTNILELARRQNVACKVSGMATEVEGPAWDYELLRPYFETVLEAFGHDRLLFGSDWPVCLLKTDYARWVKTVQTFLQPLSLDVQAAIFGNNASRIYNLSRAPNAPLK